MHQYAKQEYDEISRIVLEIAFYVYEIIKEDKPRLSERARAEIMADLKDTPMDAIVSACNSVKPREW